VPRFNPANFFASWPTWDRELPRLRPIRIGTAGTRSLSRWPTSLAGVDIESLEDRLRKAWWRRTAKRSAQRSSAAGYESNIGRSREPNRAVEAQ
jgi:hypothetical protein